MAFQTEHIMADEYSFPGYKLPVNPAWEQGTVAHGFVTPSQDRIPQVVSIPPRRALPIIFLPRNKCQATTAPPPITARS